MLLVRQSVEAETTSLLKVGSPSLYSHPSNPRVCIHTCV